jgi:hypothetical protein
MSSAGNRQGAQISDLVALKIQELHKENKLDKQQALLKIDNRDEAARAPFQFDPAAGTLHRRDCGAIPEADRTALYGVWRVSAKDGWRACPKCKPIAGAEAAGEQGGITDVLYGLLSIVSQFSSVLRERGREYRSSGDGRRIGTEFETLYSGLSEQEKGVVDKILTSFEDMTRKLRDIDATLNGLDETKGSRKGA